ncbi:hypothetical protein K1719_003263 [Acacia pycnantha]|nr:hypothetical protein K1719_003263 [Acacia pycnantha]
MKSSGHIGCSTKFPSAGNLYVGNGGSDHVLVFLPLNSPAEAKVQTLKDVLIKFQAKREVTLVQYQQYLEKISNSESKISSAVKDTGELGERATKAEIEADSLKHDLARIES